MTANEQESASRSMGAYFGTPLKPITIQNSIVPIPVKKARDPSIRAPQRSIDDTKAKKMLPSYPQPSEAPLKGSISISSPEAGPGAAEVPGGDRARRRVRPGPLPAEGGLGHEPHGSGLKLMAAEWGRGSGFLINIDVLFCFLFFFLLFFLCFLFWVGLCVSPYVVYECVLSVACVCTRVFACVCVRDASFSLACDMRGLENYVADVSRVYKCPHTHTHTQA